MFVDPRSRPVSILLACLLIISSAGCGDDEEDTTSTTTTASTPSTSESTTTAQPTTSSSQSSTSDTLSTTTATTASTTSQSTTTEPSITIMFSCGNGETGATDVPTDDIEEIDDIVNTIDLREFRDGLVEISFTAPCPSGDREVTVPATDGAVPDIATLDLCENP